MVDSLLDETQPGSLRIARFYAEVTEKETRKVWSASELIQSGICLFCDHHVAALNRARQIGPLNRDIAEVYRNAGAH
jgi:hypothetical protein